MFLRKPNRTREQFNGIHEALRKQSGDQHLLFTDDPHTDPHRPNRIRQGDLQLDPFPQQGRNDQEE